MPAQPIPVKIFLIGASGYIGGSILHRIQSSFDASSTCVSALVRSEAACQTIAAAYPEVRTLLGELRNDELLLAAAAEADVVIYAARNTQDGVDALVTGLAAGQNRIDGDGHCESKRTKLFVMLSAIISLADPKNLRLGEMPTATAKVVSDVDDMDDIMALPDYHWHVAQERAFLGLVKEKGQGAVAPVIMGLPFAVGNGAGPVRTKGFVHEYAEAVKARDPIAPFILCGGYNVWSWASPLDMASAVCFLVNRWKRNEGRDSMDGYFFVEAGQLEMRSLAKHVGTAMQDVLSAKKSKHGIGMDKSKDVECVSLQYPQFAELMPKLPGLWGVTARCKADRLKALGWTPEYTDWLQLVNDCVKFT